MRAIAYPCLCLCLALVQITRTTPRLRTTLHLSQIRFTDARTFMLILDVGSGQKAGFTSIAVAAYGLLSTAYFPYYPAARQIPRRQLHDDPVADEHSNEIP